MRVRFVHQSLDDRSRIARSRRYPTLRRATTRDLEDESCTRFHGDTLDFAEDSPEGFRSLRVLGVQGRNRGRSQRLRTLVLGPPQSLGLRLGRSPRLLGDPSVIAFADPAHRCTGTSPHRSWERAEILPRI